MSTKKQRLISVIAIACLAMALAVFAGCSSAEEPASEPSDTSAQTQTETVDPMADRTITDDAGRQVTIPGTGALEESTTPAHPAGFSASRWLPSSPQEAPWSFPRQSWHSFLKKPVDLPYLGTLSGGKELNPEAIMAEGVQVIFSVTTATPGDYDVSSADDLQNLTGIPVVVLDGSLDATPATYRTLGTLLGKEDEAEKLASYCESALSNVKNAVAEIPEDQRVSLYYAEGSEGLQTEPKGSTHSLAFDIAGANNIAQDVEAVKGKGLSPVSLEQVLAWNPQVIIAWDDEVRGGADEIIRTDGNWSTIDAVKEGRVYTMPNVPFSWCDRPPAVNRILGIQWIANTLYPEAYDVDMVEVTKEFYSMFYHAELTDEQAREILGNSYAQ